VVKTKEKKNIVVAVCFSAKFFSMENFREMVLQVSVAKTLFLLGGLLGSLGDFATSSSRVLEVDGLDDTDGDGLTHVTDSEATKRREVREGLDAKGLGWYQSDHGSITRLDELGVLLGRFAGTTIAFLLDLGELAGNVSRVAIEHGGVTVTDLARVVQHDDLSEEVGSSLGWVVLGITSNEATTQLLDGDVLDVETNIVTRASLSESFVVHLNGLDFSGQLGRGESNDHARLDDTGFNTANGHRSDTTNFVDVLKGQTESFVGRAGRWHNSIESLQQSLTISFALFALNVPSLEPAHVGGRLQHVVSVPSGNGDERNSHGVVTNLLNVAAHFLLDFLETALAERRLSGVHLVDTNDELLHTQGVGKQSVLAGLTVLRDTSLELTGTTGNNQDSAISLGGTSNHVLDEIAMAWSVNDGDVELGGFEFPQGNVDGDTTLAFSLEFVQHPGVLEGALTHFLGFLLELLNGTLVDTTALVDQVTSGRGLARVDVANNDDVDVSLLLTHLELASLVCL